MPNIPEFIFDLAHHSSFDDLQTKEQTNVLQYISYEDYQDLYEGAQLSKDYFSALHFEIPDRKQELLSQLAPKEISEGKFSKSKLLLPWQIAAGFLLLFSIYALSKNNTRVETVEKIVIKTDTVYQQQAVIQRVKDTVYVNQPITNAAQKQQARNTVTLTNQSISNDTHYVVHDDEFINILKVKEYAGQNANSKNLLLDSLTDQIGFSSVASEMGGM